MTWYSVLPGDRIFLFFAKNMSKSIGKSISKSLSGN